MTRVLAAAGGPDTAALDRLAAQLRAAAASRSPADVAELTAVVAEPDQPSDELRKAVDVLLDRPGRGLVVLAAADGAARAAVGFGTLLTHAAGLPAADQRLHDWLVRVVDWMSWWGYEVVDGSGAPWAPAGASPPLRRLAGRVRRAVRRPAADQVVAAGRAYRRRAFVVRLRAHALLSRCRLRLELAPDAIVEPGIRIELRPGRATLVVGPRCVIRNGVLLRIGGELLLSHNVELRNDVALNVKGSLRFDGRNVIGRGSMIHADDTMVWGWGASCSEYVTVLDSQHTFAGSSIHVHDQPVTAAPVTVGAFTLLGAQAVVLPGVTIGRAALVGAAAVVTRDVPDGWIALGSPARAVRPVSEGPVTGTE